MSRVKLGIIGCGGIANGKHMPSLKKLPDVEMVAFCDLIEERAVAAKEKFGSKDAKAYTDYRELLKDESIDVVYVLTPNRSHADISIDALHAGKHVMCEKPMAKCAADARRMVEAAKETGRKLTIGYQHRQKAASQYVKSVVERGDLGDIYYAKAFAIRRRGTPNWGVFLNEYEQGGGPLIDIGTHSLDLTLYLMNNYRPRMAVGSVYDKLKHQKETANPFGPWDPDRYDVEESAFGYVVMENGATIFLETSWALNTPENTGVRYLVCGTEGGADNYTGQLRINGIRHNRPYLEQPDLTTGGVAFFDGQETSPTVMEQQTFFDAIAGKGELVTKPEEAAVVTWILEGIYRSAETGQPYYFTGRE